MQKFGIQGEFERALANQLRELNEEIIAWEFSYTGPIAIVREGKTTINFWKFAQALDEMEIDYVCLKDAIYLNISSWKDRDLDGLKNVRSKDKVGGLLHIALREVSEQEKVLWNEACHETDS